MTIQRAAPREMGVDVWPRGGPPGATVALVATGFPPLQRISIGFGSFAQYELIVRDEADEAGTFTVDVAVPAWAEPDKVHFFFLRSGGSTPRVYSPPFHVTGPDGSMSVVGTIASNGADACVRLDGPNETTYTLQGDVGTPGPAGTRVRVAGTVAHLAECGGRGVPILVREIARF